MRKHLRLLSKCLYKNVGFAGLTCLVVFSVTAYLFYFSSSLKNLILKDSNIWNLGSLATADNDTPYIPLEKQTKYYKNCGMQTSCASGTFPVHLYTGLMNEDLPLICINEKKLPSNKFGRGLNVAVFNPSTSTIIRHGNFDVFVDSSDDLEIFLEVLNEGDVVVMVTHDEASTKLSAKARSLLYELGSAYIQDLDYRDVWAFVGQKGISGFTSHEYIEYLLPDYQWSKPINKSFCIPGLLVGTILRSDPISNTNENAKTSCISSEVISCNGIFNDADNSINEDVEFAINNNDHNNTSTSSIITVLIPGPDVNLFKMQSEALLLNQEIIMSNVHVFLPKDEMYLSHLAKIFQFRVHPLKDSSSFVNYTHIFHEGLKNAWELFHDMPQQYYVVLEDGVIPRKDFSDFVTSARKILDKDATLFAASAFNGEQKQSEHDRKNSFSKANIFPGVGFLLRHSSFKQLIDRLDHCCSESTFDGWNLGFPTEIVIPEISKVFRINSFDDIRDPDIFGNQNDTGKHDLHTDATTIFDDVSLHNSLLAREISSCEILSNEVVISKCLSMTDNVFNATDRSIGSQSHCVFYERGNDTDSDILNFLISCFRSDDESESVLSESQDTGALETRNGVFIIGSHSPFFTYFFKDHEPLTMEKIKIFKQSNRQE